MFQHHDSYRLRVKDVLELLAHGAGWDEILRDYPFFEADDIRAYTFDPVDFADLQQEMLVQLWRSLPRCCEEAKSSA